MDFASISSLLGSLKAATDIAKLIKESDVTLEKAETKLKLAELVSALADAKLEAAEIQQLLFDKESRILELQRAATVREQLVWQAPSYWRQTDGKPEGPFCQQCYDSKQNLIRLQGSGGGYWECRACKSSYTDAEYRARENAVIAEFKARRE